MHNVSIPPEIVERGRRLKGDRHQVLAGLDPTRTAHVVVDLQNGFMSPGAPVEVPIAREIVPNVNLISDAVRRAGGLNVFLRYTYDEAERFPWAAFYQASSTPENTAMMKAAFTRGAEHHGLWAGLDVKPGDLVVDKTRFSAFIPGTCELHDLLQRRGIDTLIITGTVTNCCCESTARDAMQMDYRIIFVADGNAAFTDAEHNATLSSMVAIFADVLSADDVVGAVGSARRPSRSAA